MISIIYFIFNLLLSNISYKYEQILNEYAISHFIYCYLIFHINMNKYWMSMLYFVDVIIANFVLLENFSVRYLLKSLFFGRVLEVLLFWILRHSFSWGLLGKTVIV